MDRTTAGLSIPIFPQQIKSLHNLLSFHFYLEGKTVRQRDAVSNS